MGKDRNFGMNFRDFVGGEIGFCQQNAKRKKCGVKMENQKIKINNKLIVKTIN